MRDDLNSLVTSVVHPGSAYQGVTAGTVREENSLPCLFAMKVLVPTYKILSVCVA